VGTLVYENIEGWAFVDAFYFSIVTLATVGYGDHYPITTFGKLFTSAYILVGVSLFLLFINELSRYIHNEK
jgi:voltage-gated potassium channel Kch